MQTPRSKKLCAFFITAEQTCIPSYQGWMCYLDKTSMGMQSSMEPMKPTKPVNPKIVNVFSSHLPKCQRQVHGRDTQKTPKRAKGCTVFYCRNHNSGVGVKELYKQQARAIRAANNVAATWMQWRREHLAISMPDATTQAQF